MHRLIGVRELFANADQSRSLGHFPVQKGKVDDNIKMIL
jgi:hypothetical protein